MGKELVIKVRGKTIQDVELTVDGKPLKTPCLIEFKASTREPNRLRVEGYDPSFICGQDENE